MADYLYSEADVRKMWKRSYEEQIGVAQAKCMEAIVRTGGKVFVSFSGGKDSAVVLYLMAEMWSITKYKKQPLRVIFSNTSNEFSCLLHYVKDYCAYIEDKYNITINLTIVRGDYTYFSIVDKVGLPFVSKKVSRMVRDTKKTLNRLGLRYADIENLMPSAFTDKHNEEKINCVHNLRELGFNDVVVLYLTGITSENKPCYQRFLPLQYRPLLDFDFDLSEECCMYLKKLPIKHEQRSDGLLPVTGEMACDSKDRLNSYRQTGCNMFDGERPKSKPIGAMTEQTLLRFIHDEKIPVAPVYGELIYKEESNTYKFSGEQRTGCKICGFGLKFDPERFVRLQKYEPNLIKLAFTSRDRGGLGYNEICSFLNENCKMNIAIPQVEQGYYQKRAEKYKQERGIKNEKSEIKRRRLRRPHSIRRDEGSGENGDRDRKTGQ